MSWGQENFLGAGEIFPGCQENSPGAPEKFSWSARKKSARVTSPREILPLLHGIASCELQTYNYCRSAVSTSRLELEQDL